jgi:hypothetical protein
MVFLDFKGIEDLGIFKGLYIGTFKGFEDFIGLEDLKEL